MVHASEFPRLSDAVVSCGIPRHMVKGIVYYCLMGQEPGDFLQRVIQNDFLGAFQHADYMNRPLLSKYAEFFLLHAPEGCSGSKEAYDQWVKQKGPASSSETSAPAKGSG